MGRLELDLTATKCEQVALKNSVYFEIFAAEVAPVQVMNSVLGLFKRGHVDKAQTLISA